MKGGMFVFVYLLLFLSHDNGHCMMAHKYQDNQGIFFVSILRTTAIITDAVWRQEVQSETGSAFRDKMLSETERLPEGIQTLQRERRSWCDHLL